MKQLHALKELADKVEAGDEDAATAYKLLSQAFKQRESVTELVHAVHAFNGSLDAAHSLHKAVLGGEWECNLSFIDAKAVASCRMFIPDGKSEWLNECADTPARAWLLAIIKAKTAELE